MRENTAFVSRFFGFLGNDSRSPSVVAVIIATAISLGYAGCSDDTVTFRSGPTDAQALAAIQFAIAQGTNILGIPLPRNVTVSKTKIHSCVSAAPQNGYRCNLSVATPDIPIIGGLSADLVLRFSNGADGLWVVFMN